MASHRPYPNKWKKNVTNKTHIIGPFELDAVLHLWMNELTNYAE